MLVGTIADQAYAGPLGLRLAGRLLMTRGRGLRAILGGFRKISKKRIAPPLEILQSVDPSFTQVPRIDDPFILTQYRNSAGYRVDFLTPNRGSDPHRDKPAKMRALVDSGAQPLRHLDFLIDQPERSVILYEGGVPATIPRAERCAAHKLIVAVERRDQVKSGKDIMQASALIEALSRKRPLELAAAWQTAWDTAARWRVKLDPAGTSARSHARRPERGPGARGAEP